MGVRARWMLVSWAVLAVALFWQQMELKWSREAGTLLREQNSTLKKICAGEHKIADVAEQVCLPCEAVQRDWIGVLGTHHDSRGRGRSRRAGGNIGGGR
ncbi:hypothetical protein LCGC14_0334730 [marine sediment metagenome]|uniref:Uncharacterized protein n=1 Tax=marine sediment metagenome TaxID=412755 RepID=A0A0F9TFG4_9ZZZZ